jgi:hypothetical protein
MAASVAAAALLAIAMVLAQAARFSTSCPPLYNSLKLREAIGQRCRAGL